VLGLENADKDVFRDVHEMKSGKYTYLFIYSNTFRNNKGQPDNKKRYVGKLDPVTGERRYYPDFLEERLSSAKECSQSHVDDRKFNASDIRQSTIKNYGAFYLFESITEQTGLKSVLMTTFPDNWEKVLTLAYYLVSTGEPALYCESWLEDTASLKCGSMSSPRISELLANITNDDRNRFYQQWGRYRLEHEYFALDTTSISSYSELIQDINFGHNRDNEKLKQVNVCLLLGEKSGLPIFQMVYEGSLNDVRTLKTTLATASGLDMKGLVLIMDKGFFSHPNVKGMLDGEEKNKFLIAMPFTCNFAKNQVKNEHKDIDTLENTIVMPEGNIRGVTKTHVWGKGKTVFAHIYCNTKLAYNTRDKLYGKVSELVNQAQKDPTNKDYTKAFMKYLMIGKSQEKDDGYTVTVRNDVIEKELKHKGWLVIISDFVDNAKRALEIYRAKDCVEKGFDLFKNCLDQGRTRMHSDSNMHSKIFIGFIALIITTYIDRIMKDNLLYKAWTMKEMLQKLTKLRIQTINGVDILYSATKEQQDIYKAFGLKSPS
jgi:transposase